MMVKKNMVILLTLVVGAVMVGGLTFALAEGKSTPVTLDDGSSSSPPGQGFGMRNSAAGFFGSELSQSSRGAIAGPKYPKHVASLMLDDVRFGQVTFNTNPEDDGKYELEVEVEECLNLVDSTVSVKLNSVEIGTLYLDEFGVGNETFFVDGISTSDSIAVEGAVILTGGEWRDWLRGPGPK
jgi:hypothetical protein